MIHRFRILNQAIPTPYSRTQNMELRLISLPCHVDTNPFMSHVEFIPNSSFQFHESSHTIFMISSYQPIIHKLWFTSHMHTHSSHALITILKFKPYIHQPSQENKHTAPYLALPRPAPRSGRRISLRRDMLAQESPLCLGEGSKKSRNQRRISLRRDPSRLGEMFARSKVERVAWATFRAIGFGWVPNRFA